MPTPPRRHALLAALPVLLACALATAPAAAQPTTTGGYNSNMMAGGERFSAPMVVLLVALIAAFFFIGFFSIYIRHCGRDAAGSGNTTIPAAAILALSRRRQQQQRGLDAEVVASFPTMRYAEAKALRVGNEAALECAVCLSEFDDDEQLTLLPKCSHAFHPDCIGEWLASHVTCPVCRCNLEPEEPAAHDGNSSGEAAALQQEDGAQPAVVIDVDHEGTDDEEERRRKEAMELKRIGSQRRAIRSRSGRPSTRLARSHSTGHSVAVQLAGDLERFTLRLPEHVRRGMVTAGEESLRRWRGVGEGSSRRGGGAGSARLARSDRWPSLIGRTFSARLPFWAAPRRTDAEGGGGEGPTATGRPKRASVADGAAASPKGSVRFDCLGGSASGARVGAVAGEEEEKPIVRQA